jgi:uncharacterized membrane protein
MGSLSSAKTLGGVGGILVFFPFLSLVGWILILLATKEISESVHDRTIFEDALIAGVTAIIGAVVFGGFVLAGFIGGLFFASGPFGFGFWGILASFWVFTIISAVFLKHSQSYLSVS